MRILLAAVLGLVLAFAIVYSPPVEKIATADQSSNSGIDHRFDQIMAEHFAPRRHGSHFAGQFEYHWIPTPKAEPFECLHISKREIRCTSLRLQTDSGQAFYDRAFARQWATLKL